MTRAAAVAALFFFACGIDAIGTLESGGSSSSGGLDGGASSGGPDGSNPNIEDASSEASVDASSDAFVEGGVVPPVPALPLDAKAACGRPSVYVDDFTDGIAS